MSAGVAAALGLALLTFGIGFVVGIAYDVRRMQVELEERERRVRRLAALRDGGRG
jgi:hypothetical protein